MHEQMIFFLPIMIIQKKISTNNNSVYIEKVHKENNFSIKYTEIDRRTCKHSIKSKY